MTVDGIKLKWLNFWRWCARHCSPALLATILAAVIAGYLLFIPPFHGLADNGDFYRAQFVNGLYRLKGYHMLDYVTPKLGIMQY